MTILNVTFKQCSHKELCVQFGQQGWLPATLEYFYKQKGGKNGLSTICKECEKAYTRIYTIEHKEEIAIANRERRENATEEEKEKRREYVRSRNLKNPEKRREYARLLYRKNPQVKIDNAKRQYRNNPEPARERSRRKRLEDPEGCKEYHKEYRKTHPEAKRASENARRAQKQNSGGTYTSADIHLLVISQTDKSGRLRCWWCGEPIKGTYHVDHRIPLSRGGSNASENLCIACIKCNLQKYNKLPGEWKGRLF